MPDDAEHKFTVIAETYARLVESGEKPKANLVAIGRELGLSEKQINSLRLRATYKIHKRGKPRFGIPEWIWPTPNEERAQQVQAA